MSRVVFYIKQLILSSHYYFITLYMMISFNHIRSIVSTFSTFYAFFFSYTGFVIGETGPGFADDPFGPPNRFFAIFSFALSYGAINFFFYFTGSIATKTGGFTYRSSYVFTSFFSSSFFLN